MSTFTSGGTWNIGAGLVGPIFEFGKNKRRVEVEYARTEQAILGYEATVLDAVAAHPILMERPIVVLGSRAVVGRPPEAVSSFLDEG